MYVNFCSIRNINQWTLVELKKNNPRPVRHSNYYFDFTQNNPDFSAFMSTNSNSTLNVSDSIIINFQIDRFSKWGQNKPIIPLNNFQTISTRYLTTRGK